MQSIYLVGGGLIIEANIPVQELEGQRGEGAYVREDTVYLKSRLASNKHLIQFHLLPTPTHIYKRSQLKISNDHSQKD